MKKIIVLLCVLSLFTISIGGCACTNANDSIVTSVFPVESSLENPPTYQKQTDITTPWWKQVKSSYNKRWSKMMMEHQESIYLISSVGLMKKEAGSEDLICLVENPSMTGLCYEADTLYYSTQLNDIYAFDLISGQHQLICSHELLTDFESYNSNSYDDFTVYQNHLYVFIDGITVVSVDLKTQIPQMFCTDVNSGVFLHQFFWYTDHAERTFSVYQKDLNDGQVRIICGDGQTTDSHGKKEMYDKLVVAQDQLYYTKRFPAKLYRYQPNGPDELIDGLENDTSGIILWLYSDGNRLYYAISQEKDQFLIFEYDPETDKTLLLKTLDSIHPSTYLQIFKNRLFYAVENEVVLESIELETNKT